MTIRDRFGKIRGSLFWKVLFFGAVGIASAAVLSRYEQFGLVRLGTEFSIALAISSFVALGVEHLLHQSLLQELESILRFLETHFGLLKAGHELKVEDILLRYGDDHGQRASERIREAITEQLETRRGEILVACVAAPGFFRSDAEIGRILWKRMTDDPGQCKLRVLLLCPECEWAEIRKGLEPYHPTKSDIRNSGKWLEQLRRAAPDRVESRCYDLPPFAFVLITDKLLFIEPYPFATATAAEGTIGGKTPMLVLGDNSEVSVKWKEHFKMIWNHPETHQFGDHQNLSLAEGA